MITEFSLVACAHSVPASRTKMSLALADRFRIPGRHTDYRDLLSDPGVDACLTHTLDPREAGPDGSIQATRHCEREDNAFGPLRTADGRVATIHTSWTEWQGHLYLEILGTHGTLVIDNDQIQGRLASHVLACHGEPLATTIEIPALAKPDPSWRRQLQALVDAIAAERDPVRSGLDGLRAARMVHALYRAAASGQAEPIPGDAPAV